MENIAYPQTLRIKARLQSIEPRGDWTGVFPIETRRVVEAVFAPLASLERQLNASDSFAVLRPAMRCGAVRLVAVWAPQGMPPDQALPIADGEVVIACVPLPRGLAGEVALVVQRGALPDLVLDEDARERLAAVLADLLEVAS